MSNDLISRSAMIKKICGSKDGRKEGGINGQD